MHPEAPCSQALHWKLFDLGGVGAWSWDFVTGKITSDGQMKRLFGFSAHEVVDDVKSFMSRIHPDDQPIMTAAVEEVLIGRASTFTLNDFRVLHPDGSVRWLSCRGAILYDESGALLRMDGVDLDITEQRRHAEELAAANRELSETRAQMQALLDAATQVSIIAGDTNGLIQVFNSGAERMLQYSASEMVGIHTPERIHLASECVERGRALSAELGREVTGVDVFVEYARQGGFDQREWTYVRKDGSTLDVSLAVTLVRDAAGVLTGYLGIATDITARKSFERELCRKNQVLLAETERAEEANRAKSAFLATMSHEIRTPMNAILGMADLLWESQLDAEQRQYVEVFRRAGTNLLSLINDILDLSKIEAGHFELEKIAFDLEDVVDRAMELTGPKAHAKGIALLSRISPGVHTSLLGDPARLQQVLVNLLGNAVKFTERGEVVLTVAALVPGRPGRIKITVEDTGIGIEAGKLDAIFEDFQQADSSTTRKYGGTGLGLGISQRLVELLGGRLTVASTPGVGSTFGFTCTFGVGEASARNSRGVLENLEGRRVLVIDDNATNRLIVRESLSAWGLESGECGCAVGGSEELARAALLGRPYALVIMDYRMPGLSGADAVACIRKAAPEAGIVVLSSDSHAGDAARCRESGVAGYAVKPVKRSDLLRLICDALPTAGAPETAPALKRQRDETPVSTQASVRILIAEDSPDNRLLIGAYLKNGPYALTFAENGKLAVEAFMAGKFDLILMDMLMPVVDGLGATRAIRQIETETGRTSVPILALTANGLPQDIEASHAAGCAAHLTKPISKSDLAAAIQRYAPPRAAIAVAIVEGMEQLAAEYLADREQELVELFQSLEAADFSHIRFLAHNLKGTGSAFGFPQLTVIGAALEHSAKNADPAEITQQLKGLADYLGRAAPVGVRDMGSGSALRDPAS